ncbi:MAG: 4'-phosphopantetheinyl transferase superfamily protein [Bacilli bacterium]|nr:4'-phosphopantetheinyl transferase superfamily protein [Bacilli bacterium]
MEIVKLFILDIDLANSYRHLILKNINDEQKEKAFRFKNEKDQMRSLLSSFLVNQLSKEELKKNKTGKPYYPNGPFFNISHSGKYVIMAVANQEVGVDIEENIEKNMDILLKIFNEAEAKMIKEHADFYYLWCAKESLIKCMGSSISKVKEVPSLPLNGLKTFKGIDYQSQTFIYDKHIISLTKLGKDPFEIKTEVIKKLPFVI